MVKLAVHYLCYWYLLFLLFLIILGVPVYAAVYSTCSKLAIVRFLLFLFQRENYVLLLFAFSAFAFSALILMVGQQERHLTYKN